MTTHLDGDVTGHVVIGTPISEHPHEAEQWGVAYAARRGLPVTLMGAYGHTLAATPDDVLLPQVTDAAGREMRDYLDSVRHTLVSATPEADIRCLATPGHAGPALVTASQSTALVVVGSRGLDGLSGLLLGSTSQFLVSRTDGPVAVVPASLTADLIDNDPVVLGVDGTSDSAASRFAFEQARAEKRPLLAVHSWESGDRWADASYEKDGEPTEEHLESVLHETIAEQVQEFPDVEVRYQVVRGESTVALLGASARAAMLVVGTRRRGEVRSLLFGSTSMRLVSRAACPTIVVPGLENDR